MIQWATVGWLIVCCIREDYFLNWEVCVWGINNQGSITVSLQADYKYNTAKARNESNGL